jgi:hypothetical protein
VVLAVPVVVEKHSDSAASSRASAMQVCILIMDDVVRLLQCSEVFSVCDCGNFTLVLVVSPDTQIDNQFDVSSQEISTYSTGNNSDDSSSGVLYCVD